MGRRSGRFDGEGVVSKVSDGLRRRLPSTSCHCCGVSGLHASFLRSASSRRIRSRRCNLSAAQPVGQPRGSSALREFLAFMYRHLTTSAQASHQTLGCRYRRVLESSLSYSHQSPPPFTRCASSRYGACQNIMVSLQARAPTGVQQDNLKTAAAPGTVDVSDTPDPAAAAAAASVEVKRAAIIAAVAAARLAQEETDGRKERKAKAEDLFGRDEKVLYDQFRNASKYEDAGGKDDNSRMQGEYGAKKFIKP